MIEPYFSDREKGPRPRIEEEVNQTVWGGIVAAIKSRIADGSFGHKYPLECPDGKGPYACDDSLFYQALKAEVANVVLEPDQNYHHIYTPRLDLNNVPPTLAALDLIEFCYRNVAKPIRGTHHSGFDHTHLSFDAEAGQETFREEINRILARNGLAYELGQDGKVVRLAPEVLRETLTSAVFRTGDTELDTLLEDARHKYLNPDLRVRKESLEKLWDAWERLKTIEPGRDKRAKAKALLDKVTMEPKLRTVLEDEAKNLTDIGNEFRIRHHETDKVIIELSEHVDYFFHRMFALIHMLLRVISTEGDKD